MHDGVRQTKRRSTQTASEQQTTFPALCIGVDSAGSNDVTRFAFSCDAIVWSICWLPDVAKNTLREFVPSPVHLVFNNSFIGYFLFSFVCSLSVAVLIA